jgi:membrane-associated protease RseP (regulator of RpoE activity)
MKFLYYDIIFLIISCIAVGLFLYKNRKKLQKEGILFLYRTKIGINIIDKISRKFPKTVNVLSYISIFCGYILMVSSLYLIWLSLILMINAVNLPKIPPIFPLVPYLPDLFKLDFLPPFYFTYWIISIAIVAICHEFMHGVFARFGKIKLKSTGFGFLGPFLAAFVEMDEKQAAKKSVKTQLSILSGGSFANLILTILFIAIINLFFISLYTPSGMSFNTYSLSIVNFSGIASMGNIGISNPDFERLSMAYQQLDVNKTEDIKINADGKSYLIDYETLGMQIKANKSFLVAYDDTPAYNHKISGAIKEVVFEDKEFRILNQTDFSEVLSGLKPGDKITLKTTTADYNITLSSDPKNSSKAYLGIGVIMPKSKLAWLANFILVKNDFSTYYEPILGGELSRLTIFIFNLLFWIILINVSVMIVNMLPFGIFDGGRFFYLTILGLTRSKKIAEKSFGVMNFIIMAFLVLLMVVWFFKII